MISALGGTKTITDFSAAEGDTLRLDDILVCLGNVEGDALSAHLEMAFVDAATVVRIDTSGAGDFADPNARVVFETVDLAGG